MDRTIRQRLKDNPANMRGHAGIDPRHTGKPRQEMGCEYCGCTFTSVRRMQRWCSVWCRARFINMVLKRGAAVYDQLMAWRKTRGAKGAWTEITNIIDRWITEDRERKEKMAAEREEAAKARRSAA